MDQRGEHDWDAAVDAATSPPAPYTLDMPEAATAPLVFSSPHSGRLYPPDMMAASALDAASIRRSEDAFVDILIGEAPTLGIPLISATYARAYIDVNREPYELDPAMFQDPLPAFASTHTARIAAGLGSIARIVAEGQEIYRDKLTYADAQRRIEAVHRPYHTALRDLIEGARRRFGVAVLIDWHSMPSAAARKGRGGPDPDFVLGDRFGVACAPAVTTAWERALEAKGYAVTRNAPFAGGFTTEFYGQPSRNVHALQIEINRRLYLDETALQPSGGFDRLRRDLTDIIAAFAAGEWPAVA